MPTVLLNFLNSEKGLAFLLTYIGALVLAAIGRIEPTSAQWLDASTIWLGIYTGGKALQGAAASIASRPLAVAAPATDTTTVIATTTHAPAPTPPAPPAPTGT